MRTIRRFAAPAIAVLVALGASGCAGLSFNTGCGIASMDPMTDGASRMNGGFQRHQAIAQHQAYQAKATSLVSARFSRDIRKPGGLPMTQSPGSMLCYR